MYNLKVWKLSYQPLPQMDFRAVGFGNVVGTEVPH
jgi:hypothetical protein